MEDSVEVKKSHLAIVIVAVVVFIVGFYVGGMFGVPPVNGGNGDDGNGGGGNTLTSVVEEALLVSLDDDDVLGNEGAKVTMIEFSDFECSFCLRFTTETVSLIKRNYVDTGKVKLVFRDFPLSFHANAQKAAEAAECAGEQGMFWEMHDAIFANQDAITVTDLKGYADDIGLDTTAFDTCLDSDEMASEVAGDMIDGQSYGVGGTPASFIFVNEAVDSATLAELDSVATSLNEQAGRPMIMIYKGSSTTTIYASGALPYEIFDALIGPLV